jgi:hypothetical protein
MICSAANSHLRLTARSGARAPNIFLSVPVAPDNALPGND